MEKAKNLENRQKKLLAKMLAITNDVQLSKKNNCFRLNGYLYELRVDYKKGEFDFMPKEFVIDERNLLWVCLGVGRSPNFGSGEVLWFLSEKGDANFFDNFLPKKLQNYFAKVPSLVA